MMCRTGSYLCGMGAGLMVGAIVGAAMLSRPEARKTAVGKTMQKVREKYDRDLAEQTQKVKEIVEEVMHNQIIGINMEINKNKD